MLRKLIQRFCLTSVTSTLIASQSSYAYGGGETPVSDGLQYITNAMYGATGITVATISVMIVGLLCLGHFLKWSTLGYTVLGISIIFGSGTIVNGITSLIH